MKSTITLLAGLVLTTTAFAGDHDKKAIVPTPLDEAWHFSLAMPGWIAGLEGDTGVGHLVSSVDVSADDIIRRVDMTASFRGEASKGRFGIMGEFLYMSLSDGIGTNTVVKKIDLQFDQTLAELALRWRLIDSARGSLDVYAGARYTNMYQKLVLQPNDERIEAAVDSLAAAVGSELRSRVVNALVALAGKDPTLPTAPIGNVNVERLSAAIAKIKGTVAERKAAIAKELHRTLSRTVSRTDDWVDPFIGLRGRYNLNEKFYLTAKGEIGGFGVGADFTWQASAALGFKLKPNMFTEVGYRALGVDYEEDGLTNDVVTHGAEVTLGILF